jgi:RNA polymerase-binding transcription factor DksA
MRTEHAPQVMYQATAERNRQRLVDLGSRLTDEVKRMVEAVPDDLQSRGALSHMPTHSADQAMDSIDKELILIRNEQDLQRAVNGALDRLEQGNYGRCQTCGGEIGEERLDALPYAEQCIVCAEQAER